MKREISEQDKEIIWWRLDAAYALLISTLQYGPAHDAMIEIFDKINKYRRILKSDVAT
jgi:hypothetical protein